MSILTDISENLQRGKAKIVKELVQQAIDEGIPVQQILDEGLLNGMGVIGEKFKNNEVFVPEVLVAARAMNMGCLLYTSWNRKRAFASAPVKIRYICREPFCTAFHSSGCLNNFCSSSASTIPL